MKKNSYPVKYLIGLVFLSLFSSCDIFNTRDAEKPDQPRSNYQQPVEPSVVINNLINSFIDKNAENYLSCFSDHNFSGKEFVFSPSAGASSQFPSLTEWNKKNEEQYFNNIKTKVSETAVITLSLTNQNFSPLGDSLIYTATYSLNIPHNDPNIPVNYQGDLRFSMIRDSRALWSIYYWLDIKKDENSSWSELKGRFY